MMNIQKIKSKEKHITEKSPSLKETYREGKRKRKETMKQSETTKWQEVPINNIEQVGLNSNQKT